MGRVTLGKHFTLWMQLSHPWTALTQRESYHESCCLSLLTVTLPLLRDFLLKKKKWFFFLPFLLFLYSQKQNPYISNLFGRVWPITSLLVFHAQIIPYLFTSNLFKPISVWFFFKSVFSVPRYFLRQQDGPGPPWTFLHLTFLWSRQPCLGRSMLETQICTLSVRMPPEVSHWTKLGKICIFMQIHTCIWVTA